MRPEFEKYSAIDDYLSGKLSDHENTAFEKTMSEDSSLREDVFDRKVVNEIIIEKRFFDITSGLRTAPSATSSLLSKSIKRFVGIGAAVTVILFTPYYFSKRAEQTIENTSSPEHKSETAEVAAATAHKEQKVAETNTASLEEKAHENTTALPVEAMPSERIETDKAEEKIAITKTVQTKAVVSTNAKKVKKSSVLEIPIDDPTAKGHQANSYHFNPAKGQNWKIPLKNHSTASITIFNKEGDEVYSASLEKGKNTTWAGISNDGSKQKAGKYAYLLDFGNGDIEHGHVTINP